MKYNWNRVLNLKLPIILQKNLFNKVYFTVKKALINELLKPKILNFLKDSISSSENGDSKKMVILT